MTNNNEQRTTPSMRDVSFAVVDFETTGINPETDRVIQVAAIVINGEGEIVDSFDTVVRPENPAQYTHGAEHVHGISVEQVAQGMPLREALEKLWTISEGNVFTAHNAQFDINFLHAESQRVGLENKVDTYVDTLALARRTDQARTRKHSLHALCEHYGINHENAHEAKSDATATAELLIHLMREMEVQQPDQLPDLFS
jgi:DNA polymerase III epsilon subunit family exonuclease